MSTYVILCWRSGTDQDRPPDAVLGPFTRSKADRVMGTLTCQYCLWQATTETPVWAS